MGNNRCLICSKSGPRGYFTFPSLKFKPFLLQKWLESLAIDQIPKRSATVCYRHFRSDEINFTDNSTYPAKGKTPLNLSEIDIFWVAIFGKITFDGKKCQTIFNVKK